MAESTAGSVTVRHVETRDVAKWLEMRRALWPEESLDDLSRDVARFLNGRSRNEAVLVAEDAKQTPLGFAELSVRAYAEGCSTDRVAYLEGWYVTPQARRKGVGRALVAAAEQWGRSVGCIEFASDALLENHVSAAAHKALGFEEVEQIRCFRKAL